MKKQLFIVILCLSFTISVQSQFSISGLSNVYIGAVNEEELPEYDPIKMNTSFGIKGSLALKETKAACFDIFCSYSGGQVHYPDNNRDYQVYYVKAGTELNIYAASSSFYWGIAGEIAWATEEEEDNPTKGLGFFGKVGIGKIRGFFLEGGIELLSTGTQLIGKPKDEIRLNYNNLFISTGIRF
ncbi:MAG: hypothetical protein JXP36_03605 [Bacteroidales bacterium]|nr:hypothetical protein [Bacteroidales bacterium]